jgi:hypothetical protein
MVAMAATLQAFAGSSRRGAIGLCLRGTDGGVGLRAGDGRRAERGDGEGGGKKQGMTLHA